MAKKETRAAAARRRKSTWLLHYKGSLENFDPAMSLAYWRTCSTEEKFRATNDMIREAEALRGRGCDEPRLLRSTAIIRRTRRC